MKGKQSIYSRNDTKEWVPVTVHRAGLRDDPNSIHISDGYMTGTQGFPRPVIRLVKADGTEKWRGVGSYSGQAGAYEEGDRIEARIPDLSQISVYYVRYNQVKEIPFNLGDLINTRTIGLRNNGTAGLGHVDLSNLHYLENLDLSGASSVTDLTVSPQAPIDFYYLQGTGITQAVIDKTIQAAVDSGIINGTMSYDGRPSYDATANYNTLVDRGWSMSLAPYVGTVEKLGDTLTGVSTGELIGGSHRVTFRAMNADGTVRHTGAYSYSHPGDLPDFINNGWIETEYYHPSIIDLKVEGKQLKNIFLSHLTSMRFGYFNDNFIQTADISTLTNLETLHLRNNPSFASLTGILNNPVLTDLDIRDTNMGSTAIDQILANLNTNGASNGIFQYSVKPNKSAIADYDALIAKGWTLSIAPDRFSEVPSDPTNVRKTSSPANTLNYTWDASERVEYYEVRIWHYSSSMNVVEDVTYQTTDITGTLTNALENVQYTIEVTAYNSVGPSNMVDTYTAAGVVLAPDLEFSNIGLDFLTISWSGGQGTLKLYREINTNSPTLILTTTNTAGSYTDSNLVSANGYGYYFIAENSYGMKTWSFGINATVGEYYIDSVDGLDSNDGRVSSPWKTLNKLKTYDLPNGVDIYLKGGQNHTGNITAREGITYRSYGTGKAIVSSGTGAGFVATNVGNVGIENIIFQGSGSLTSTANGVHFINNQSGNTKLPNINLLNVEVIGYKDYGIMLDGQNVSSGFDNVTIDGCVVHDILIGGIVSYGQFDSTKTTYAHSNVHVTNCEVYNIHGDANYTSSHSGNGILLSDVQHSSITHSSAHDSAENSNWSNGGAVGIWYWDADDVVIEHCEAYNMSSGLTNKDGAGFDLDGGVTNGVMRYNYSRNNDGGGFIIGQFGGARPMDNVMMHNNISDNDAVKYGSSILLFSGSTNMTNISVINNTVYQSTQTDGALETLVWSGGSLGNPEVANNILFGSISSSGLNMVNNWLPSSGDPKFVNPIAGNADGFKIQETSPLIDAGFYIDLGTITDYFGATRIKGEAIDIGAHEYPVPAPFAFTLSVDNQVGDTYDINWTTSKWAESYTIYYREQGTSVWYIEEPNVPKGNNSITVTGERGSGIWEYYAVASNAEGEIASNTVAVTISASGTLAITNPTEGESESSTFIATFEDNENSVLTITSPAEGSSTGSTITITFDG